MPGNPYCSPLFQQLIPGLTQLGPHHPWQQVGQVVTALEHKEVRDGGEFTQNLAKIRAASSNLKIFSSVQLISLLLRANNVFKN